MPLRMRVIHLVAYLAAAMIGLYSLLPLASQAFVTDQHLPSASRRPRRRVAVLPSVTTLQQGALGYSGCTDTYITIWFPNTPQSDQDTLPVRAEDSTTPTFTASPTPSATPLNTPTATVSPTATRWPMEIDYFVLQQGREGYIGAEDTYLDAWFPDDPHGTEPMLVIRAESVRSTLLRFSLSPLPVGRPIISATLSLFAIGSGGLPEEMSAYRVLRPWNSAEATWNLADTSVPWSQPGCNGPGADREITASSTVTLTQAQVWYDLDLTDLVRAWVAGTQPNYGVLLVGSGPHRVQYAFASAQWGVKDERPKLIVAVESDRSVPTPTTTPTATSTPTNTPTPTATSSPTETNTPSSMTSLSIPLYEGANLISIPLTIPTTTVQAVLSSIEGHYTRIYAHDNQNKTWRQYIAGAPDFVNDLRNIDEKMGLWVVMTISDTLEVSGWPPAVTHIPLYPGPNLIGFPAAESRPVTETLAALDGMYTRIYSYHCGEWKHYIVEYPPHFNTLTHLEPKQGYWIYVNITCTLEIEY